MHTKARLRQAFTLGGLSVRELVIRTYRGVIDNEIQTRAAGVAFYAMLALVPFIGLILFMAVQLLPDLTGKPSVHRIGDETVSQFQATTAQILPREASAAIEDQINRLQKNDAPVTFLSFGLVVTLWLASSMFVAIIDATNRIYGVVERRNWFKVRLLAIAMTVIQATIFIVALLSVVASSTILEHFNLGRAASILANTMHFGAIFVMVLLSFALTFYVAPDADQKWEWVTPGSLAGAALFLISTLGFRIYVQNFANYNQTYGFLGGVMVLLFWFWIAGLVLLGAAQVNKIIEEASPLGKNTGQRVSTADALDFARMTPEVNASEESTPRRPPVQALDLARIDPEPLDPEAELGD